MEDLATDRIYRLMIAQRLRHGAAADVVDASRRRVLHTPELVTTIFDEELERILSERPSLRDLGTPDTFQRARRISEDMIRRGAFDPV
jgi:malate synthase